MSQRGVSSTSGYLYLLLSQTIRWGGRVRSCLYVLIGSRFKYIKSCLQQHLLSNSNKLKTQTTQCHPASLTFSERRISLVASLVSQQQSTKQMKPDSAVSTQALSSLLSASCYLSGHRQAHIQMLTCCIRERLKVWISRTENVALCLASAKMELGYNKLGRYTDTLKCQCAVVQTVFLFCYNLHSEYRQSEKMLSVLNDWVLPNIKPFKNLCSEL